MTATASRTSFRNLKVWQNALQLTVDIYQLTNSLPSTAAGQQIIASLQQTASEIPTHIAAGHKTGSRMGMHAECLHAVDATSKLETLLTVCGQLYPNVPSNDLLDSLEEIDALIRSLIERLGAPRTRL